MRKQVYRTSLHIMLIISCLTACNDRTENNTASETADTSEIQKPIPAVHKDSITTWEFDADRDIPVPSGKKYLDTVTAQELVGFASTGDVKLDLIKLSADTIFVRIKDSEHLTQRMGTAGAKGFISVATFTLTELKGIRYVNFDFIEGDHAVPGTYSRAKFKEH